jgi:glutaminyl-peptide cyclotransferase
MTTRASWITALLLLLLEQSQPAAISGYKLVHIYPHDPDAFTQGLLYYDGYLYEGTGLNGHSSVRKVDLTSGKVLQRVDVSPSYFGEGLVLWKDKLIELTWIIIIYSQPNW